MIKENIYEEFFDVKKSIHYLNDACCTTRYQNCFGLEDIKLAYLYSWISPLGLIIKRCQKIVQKSFSQTASQLCIYVIERNCPLSPLHFQMLINSHA